MKTKYGSFLKGKMSKGCRLCLKGAKLVLFITGLCKKNCYFCPVSNERKVDAIWANERKVRSYEDILEEARLIDARGTGITGGEPLLVFNRTLEVINLLKENFGKHHIHLYTCGDLLNQRQAELLADAGLDELRINAELQGLKSLEWVTEYLHTGIEIPAIPDKDYSGLIEYLPESNYSFININELELSETNAPYLKKYGLVNDSSNAIKGSFEKAMEIFKNLEGFNIHFCPSFIKDSVQLKNRFLRRAKNVRKKYEEITEEGLLVKGIIYPKSSKDLKTLKKRLIFEFSIPEDMFHVDESKERIETSWYIAERLSDLLDCDAAIVKEYPTHDRLEIERIPLPL
ncbi:MAG: radical SAM protein [Candidatus Hydrothermarchaeota archaeon]